MSCDWGQIISFWGDIINLWGHIISFWGRYPYWGQGSIGGKIIILWGDFELGARLLTYGGILLTFGGVIINYILHTSPPHTRQGSKLHSFWNRQHLLPGSEQERGT